MDRLVGLLAVDHALQVEGGDGPAAFLFADQQGLARGRVLHRTPGQRERLHHGESLRGIDRESAGAHDIADDVNQPGAAHLYGIAGDQLGVVVGAGVGSAGVEHHRMRRPGRVVAMEDIHQPSGVGREAGGGRDQVQQAMVEGVGIDPGAGHLAQNAHVLAGIGGHQHRNLRMEQHALRHQRGFNGARGGLLAQSANMHFVDHGQHHRARRGDAHQRMKLRGVVLADIQEVAGANGSGHGRCGLRTGHRRQPGRS